MAKKANIALVEDNNEVKDLHPEIADLAAEYLGNKVAFSMKGFGSYAINANKVAPATKGIKVRPKKPQLKYTLDIQENLEGTLRQYLLRKGKTIVTKIEADDKKVKFKKSIETVMITLVKNITEEANAYLERAHLEIAQELTILHESGMLSGSFDGIPEDIYHQCIGVSTSMLKVLMSQTYAHLKESMEQLKKDTDAKRIGRAFHTKVLTPKLFKKNVFVMPEVNKMSISGKAEYNRLVMSNIGKTIISPKDYEMILGMEAGIKRHPILSKIHKEIMPEVSFFWEDDFGGLSRGRIDGIVQNPSAKLVKLLKEYLPGYTGQSIVFDLKSDVDASDYAFSKKIANLMYHAQAGNYVDALKKTLGGEWYFLFAVVEKSAPYEANYHWLSDAQLEQGMLEIHAAMEIYYEHEKDKKKWQGYPLKKDDPITLPSWTPKTQRRA